jgi:hypothetical protein
MRRLVAVAGVWSAFGVFAAPAWAPDHRMNVNEIYPASSAAQQFVELQDPEMEPFPSSDYRLLLYDDAGMEQGFQTLNMSPFANSTETILVGRAAPRDAALTLSLPTGTGQVCFRRNAGYPLFPPLTIDCLGYGSVTNALGEVVATRAAGQSAQRTETGVCAGAPTRDTPNACGGGGGGVVDTSDPELSVKRKKTQDVDKVILRVETNEATTVTITARVSVPGSSAILRFRKLTRSLQAGVRKRIRIRLKKSRKRAVKSAIEDGAKPRARVKITAEDAAGNTTTKRRRIRLKN